MEEGGNDLVNVTVYQYGKKIFRGKKCTNLKTKINNGYLELRLYYNGNENAAQVFIGYGLAYVVEDA